MLPGELGDVEPTRAWMRCTGAGAQWTTAGRAHAGVEEVRGSAKTDMDHASSPRGRG